MFIFLRCLYHNGMSTFSLYAHWQIAGFGQDGVVNGIDDIDLCIDHILSTRRGTDILRPQFGSHHFDYIDQPSDIAMPHFVREIYAALEQWEKRIIVEKIDIAGIAPHLEIIVYYRLTDEAHREIYKTVVNSHG